MPTYTLTAPNGKKIKITGDKPPTEGQIVEAFAAAYPDDPEFKEGFFDKVKSAGAQVIQSASKTVAGAMKWQQKLAEKRGAAEKEAGLNYKPPIPQKEGSFSRGDLVQAMDKGVEQAFPTSPVAREKFWTGDVPAAIGSLGAFVASGPMSPMTAFGAEANDAYEREIARQEREGEEPNEDKALFKASTYGAVSTAIEYFLGAGYVLSKIGQAFGKEGVKEATRAVQKAGWRRASQALKEGGRGAIAGAVEEGLQQVAQDVIVEGEVDTASLPRTMAAGMVAEGGMTTAVGAFAPLPELEKPNPKTDKQINEKLKTIALPEDPVAEEGKPEQEVKADEETVQEGQEEVAVEPQQREFRQPLQERDNTKQSQSRLSSHEYVVQEEEARQQWADDVATRHGDRIDTAAEEALQIKDPSYRDVAVAEVLTRAMIRFSEIGAADPVLMQTIQKLKWHIEQSGSSEAQALQARQQINRKLKPFAAAMSWESIRQDQVEKAVAPDFAGVPLDQVMEAIRKAIKAAQTTGKNKPGTFKTTLGTELGNVLKPEVIVRIAQSPRLIDLAAQKDFDPMQFFDGLAESYGLETSDGPTTRELQKLAGKAAAAPVGVVRNKVYQRMENILWEKHGGTFADLARDYWYANVLSSMRTLWDVLSGSTTYGIALTGLAAIDQTVRGHPQTAFRIMSTWFEGVWEGLRNLKDIILTGDRTRLADFDRRVLQYLDGFKTKGGKLVRTGRTNTWEHWARQKGWRHYAGSIMGLVNRAMTALDYVQAPGTRDAMLLYSAMTRQDQESLDAINRRFNKVKKKQAKKQAQEELGQNAKPLDVRQRQREILEEGVAEESKKVATELTRLAALNADPVGVGGVVYRWVSSWPFLARAVTGLAFIRAAINMAQQASDWMPVTGALNYTRAKLNQKLPDGHPLHILGLDVPPERRRLIFTAQLMGLGITAGLAALFLGDDDDEERVIDITGTWAYLTPAQRQALYRDNNKPLSIRIAGKYTIALRNTPVAAIVALIGYMRDQQKYNGKNWDENTVLEKVVNAWLSGMTYVREVSALSQFSELIGVRSTSRPDVNHANRVIAQMAGGVTGGAVPLSSMNKDLRTLFDPQYYRPEQGMEHWLRSIPWALPAIKDEPAINQLGDPIEIYRHPWERQLQIAPDDPIYRALAKQNQQGVFISGVSRKREFVDVINNIREMTNAEWYEFSRMWGGNVKKRIAANPKAFSEMPPEHAKRLLDKWVSRERERAIRQLGLSPAPQD